jgi:hypothetical protein
MTVENTNIFSFSYKDCVITIWFSKYCCGQKLPDKLWVWNVVRGGQILYQQREVNKKDAEVNALVWVDTEMNAGNKIVDKSKADVGDTSNTSFQYKGLNVHVLYCKHCGQKSNTKKIWQWCIAEGGNGESEEEVILAAKNWIDKMKQNE